MKRFYASTFTYTILAKKNDNLDVIYPYFRDDERGDKEMFLVSPQHGRSYMVGLKDCDRYVICKGGGLSYTTQNIMDTPEMEADIWGLLWYKDALRDFTLCNEVASIGEIKTNRMECVIELDLNLSIRADKKQKPVLLQYSVESPYRISDAAFMNKSIINKEVAKWEIFNQKSYKQKYLIAAEVLIRT